MEDSKKRGFYELRSVDGLHGRYVDDEREGLPVPTVQELVRKGEELAASEKRHGLWDAIRSHRVVLLYSRSPLNRDAGFELGLIIFSAGCLYVCSCLCRSRTYRTRAQELICIGL